MDGFSVQKMVQCPGSQELMAGVVSDPVFGPVILFGQGGSAADVIGDQAVALPTLNMHLARELISRTRIYNVLRDYRPQGSKYRRHLPDPRQAFAPDRRYSTHRRLLINPLFADDQDVLAVETSPPVGTIPTAPSPPDDSPLPSGARRRLRPQDWAPGAAMTHPPGRRAGTRGLLLQAPPRRHPATLLRIAQQVPPPRWPASQIDYDREMAFIATAPDAGGKPDPG